ncbi:MAG TPA: energy transducer TonB [Gemmatimonadales bacterium]|jgi:protein TonB|nr:energy transducer TonB [Gemmatimonadales bacterium]
MLQRLPESGRPRGHHAWQTGTSAGIHVIIIGAAVWVTERPVEIAAARTITPGVTFTVPRHPLPADRSRETPSPIIAAPAPAIPVVTTVPVTVPPVTMDDHRFDPSDYAGTARQGDVVTGIPFDPDSVGDSRSLITSAEADEVPVLLQSGPRIAPPGLEGVAARVTLQFVIGTDGRVEPGSIEVLESSNPAFRDAARRMVETSVYRPGRRHGHPVRVLVRQGVSFTESGEPRR